MTHEKTSWIANLVAGAELQRASDEVARLEKARAAAESERAAAAARLAEVEAELGVRTLERQNARGILAAIDTSYAYLEFDPTGHVLTANSNFCRLLGCDASVIVGQHHRNFVDPAEANTAAYRDFWSDLNAGKTHVGTFRRLTKTGQEVWLQATYAPVKDELGRVSKIVKIATDVSSDMNERADHNGQLAAIGKAQGVIEFSLDGKVLDANPNFLDALGYTLSEIKGQHHSLFVDPTERASAEYRLFWDKLGRGEFDAGQYKRIGKGGKEIWIQASYNPILGLNGKPFKVVKYATDITADMLQKADLSGQIDAIGKAQGVIEFTLDGKVVDANQNFLVALGYTLNEIKGQHHSLFVDPTERASAEYRLFWDKLGRGQFDAGQYKRIGKGGKEIWIQASYNPILDMNGKPIKVVKYATDITADMLQKADFRGQIDAIGKAQGVIEFSLDGKVINANPNFLDALGYTLNEIKGQHHSLFVDPTERASAEYRLFWDKLGRGEFDAGQYKRIGKGGKEIWIQASYNPILDMNGKPFKVVKYASETTAQVLAARMLAQAVEQAQSVTLAAREGDLSQRIPLEGKTGSTQVLCSGINTLMDTTGVIFDDIGRVFGALSSGDLTQRITRDYAGTFGQVKDDANSTTEKLAEIIEEVRAAANALTGAANQVSATAQSLSQAASEQASSVEETTASIETMSGLDHPEQRQRPRHRQHGHQGQQGSRRRRRCGDPHGGRDEADRPEDQHRRRHRLPDQPAGAQRGDRGGTRRRARQGLRGGGRRGAQARRAQPGGGQGDRRPGQQQRVHRRARGQAARRDRAVDPEDQRAGAGDRRRLAGAKRVGHADRRGHGPAQQGHAAERLGL